MLGPFPAMMPLKDAPAAMTDLSRGNGEVRRPLCADIDGTLSATDLIREALPSKFLQMMWKLIYPPSNASRMTKFFTRKSGRHVLAWRNLSSITIGSGGELCVTY